jgi:hypothetical protein
VQGAVDAGRAAGRYGWGRRTHWPGLVSALLLVWVALPAQAAPKTDVVLLTDGSRIIGELKSLGRGRLTLSTDPISTIYIEWDRVARLTSKQPLRFETRTGAIYFGSLVESKGTGYLRIKGDIETTDLLTLDVVRIETLAPGSRTCWSGDLSAGYSLVSANRQQQFNFNLNAQCRTERLLTKLAVSDIRTSTSGAPESRTAAAQLDVYRLFTDRWYAGGLVRLDRNDQLGIDSRTSVGAGGGRFLVQSNSMVWGLSGGVVETREHDVASTNPTTSTEGMMAMSFDWFRYSSPELDLATTVTVFPSLTESGRWRGNGTVSLKWEIFSNFFVRLQFTGDFDNRSGDGGQSKTDYNLSTSVGYSVNE